MFSGHVFPPTFRFILCPPAGTSKTEEYSLSRGLWSRFNGIRIYRRGGSIKIKTKFVFCHLNYCQVLRNTTEIPKRFFYFLFRYARAWWLVVCLTNNFFAYEMEFSDSVHAQAYSYKIIQIRYQPSSASLYYSVNCPECNLIKCVHGKISSTFCLFNIATANITIHREAVLHR